MERTRLSLYTIGKALKSRAYVLELETFISNEWGFIFAPLICFILSHNIGVLQRDDDDDVNDDDEKSIDRSIVSRLEKTYTV